MTEYISIEDRKGRVWQLPNSWEGLSPEAFIDLAGDLALMTKGVLSPGMVRLNHVLRFFHWDPGKIREEDAWANVSWLADRVTFIFSLSYPDNDAALSGLPPEQVAIYKKTPPDKVDRSGLSRYLASLEYRYVIDACFYAQLLPVIQVGNKRYAGYRMQKNYSVITCSLTALQYIEARQTLRSPDSLPLLAAILYYPDEYNSESAVALAEDMEKLSPDLLNAILLNFLAMDNYLLRRTDFQILTLGSDRTEAAIKTGPLDALYNFAADGLGDVRQLETMNVITYLSLLRKQLIDSVITMAASELDAVDISNKTGLPVPLITKILTK